MLHSDLLSRSAALYLQEAGVAVRHVIRAAHWIVVCGADLLATSE